MGIHTYMLKKAYGRCLIIIAIELLLVFGFPTYSGEWTVTHLHELPLSGAILGFLILGYAMVALSAHVVMEWMRVENFNRKTNL